MKKLLITLLAVTTIFFFGIARSCDAQDHTYRQTNVDSTIHDNSLDSIQFVKEDPIDSKENIIHIALNLIGFASVFLILFGTTKWVIYRKDDIKSKSGKLFFLIGIIILFITLLAFKVTAYYLIPSF